MMSGMRTFEGYPGEHIADACERLVNERRLVGEDLLCDFNGVGLVATHDATAEDLRRHYAEEVQRRQEAWLASEECKAQEEKAREAAALAKATYAAAIADCEARGVPAPTWLDDERYEAWKVKNSGDGYSLGCFTYAETWARLMEARILAGQTVAECASPTSHIADVEGITGAMHGFAVGILKECWVHGADLLAWHRAGRL